MSLHTVNIGGAVFTFIPTSMVGDPVLSDTLLLNNELNRWVFLEGCKNEEEELALIHSIVSQATSAEEVQTLLDEVGMTLSLESSFLQDGDLSDDVVADLDLLHAWERQVCADSPAQMRHPRGRFGQTGKGGSGQAQQGLAMILAKKQREIDALSLDICSSLERSLATGEVPPVSSRRQQKPGSLKSRKKQVPVQRRGK